MKTLVYLHGFRSSSGSRKAGELGAALHTLRADWEYVVPDLSFDPAQAFAQIETIAARSRPAELTLVGSSLGGYYAHTMADTLGCRAVLLNPSIRPFDTLARHLGPTTNLHTGEPFTFTSAHLDALHARYRARPASPGRVLLIVEMGDELLDHRATTDYFAGATVIALPGGNHDLTSFPAHIPAVLAFAGLPYSSSSSSST